MMTLKFNELFKKYRLRSEFETFTELGEALAEKGLVYENSIFSHWQKGTRIPTSRFVVLKLLEVFIEREAVTNLNAANDFLSSAGHGHLTEWELEKMRLPQAFFGANDFDKKLEVAKNLLEEFSPFLKQLNSLVSVNQAKITYHSGRRAIRRIYEEALTASELCSYFNVELVKKALPENDGLFLEGLHKNKMLKLRELYQDTSYAKKEAGSFYSRSQSQEKYLYKFLPESIHLSAPIDTLIYNGKVSFVNCGTDKYGVVIENSDYYQNIKQLFDFMWGSLPGITR